MDTYLNGSVKHMKVTNAEPFANCVIRKFKWLVEESMLCYNMPTRLFASRKQHEPQTTEQPSVPSSSGQSEMGSMSSEVSQQCAKQASIKDFFMRTKSGDQPKTTEIECKGSESTLTVQDEVLKAETLWALKTASDNIPFRTTDGIPELFQRMFVDSTIAQHMTMSRTKVS